ncbi:MAG: LamG-like jellyroll fold domain-containing protein [Verrucomicrobiota bacterium]|jgi:hypothetical protein
MKSQPDTLRRLCWRIAQIVFFFVFLASSRLLAVIPAPGGGATNSYPWLDSWTFQDTTNWTSDLGYFPNSYNNISVSSLGPGNSLDVDSTNASWLDFPVWEDGGTNLNIVSVGSVMFWFAPNWASTSDTNDLGTTGPGVWSRLLEIGTYTTNASIGWWSLYMDDVGNNIYFSAQDGNGNAATYLSAPVTFTSNVWHLIVLSWTSTNTSLYVDGICMTNGPGISILPSTSIISQGFTIGSDAATGTLQMHGAMNSLTSYGYALDAGTVSANWVLDGVFYLRNPDNLGNFDNPPYSPGLSDIYDVVSGPGYLQVIGTNTTTCFTNSNVWITNVTSSPGTNGSVNLSFMVIGGNPDWPYDVFATTYFFKPISNSVWSWMGQAYPCETNVIYGLTNRAVYLLLGTPLSYDGDGFTVAFDNLILHINPYNPDAAGDGIANGFKLLAGLPLTTPVTAPSLNSISVPCCPIP